MLGWKARPEEKKPKPEAVTEEEDEAAGKPKEKKAEAGELGKAGKISKADRIAMIRERGNKFFKRSGRTVLREDEILEQDEEDEWPELQKYHKPEE